LYNDIDTLLPAPATVKSFFFNNIPDKDFTLDIGKGYAIKTLDDSRAYFDYNNVNNNFVISQIDTEYFTDTTYDTAQGIIITNSSKLNY
jgi:phosphotransferase system IIA component